LDWEHGRVAERRIGGWIVDDNTERFLYFVAGCVGYSFDPSDWMAIETALEFSRPAR